MVFNREMGKCLDKLPLTSEDKEQFVSFAKGKSFQDSQMQLKNIENSKELLKLTIVGLEKENTEKCRMAVGLGAMSGLLLVIILL